MSKQADLMALDYFRKSQMPCDMAIRCSSQPTPTVGGASQMSSQMSMSLMPISSQPSQSTFSSMEISSCRSLPGSQNSLIGRRPLTPAIDIIRPKPIRTPAVHFNTNSIPLNSKTFESATTTEYNSSQNSTSFFGRRNHASKADTCSLLGSTQAKEDADVQRRFDDILHSFNEKFTEVNSNIREIIGRLDRVLEMQKQSQNKVEAHDNAITSVGYDLKETIRTEIGKVNDDLQKLLLESQYSGKFKEIESILAASLLKIDESVSNSNREILNRLKEYQKYSDSSYWNDSSRDTLDAGIDEDGFISSDQLSPITCSDVSCESEDSDERLSLIDF